MRPRFSTLKPWTFKKSSIPTSNSSLDLFGQTKLTAKSELRTPTPWVCPPRADNRQAIIIVAAVRALIDVHFGIMAEPQKGGCLPSRSSPDSGLRLRLIRLQPVLLER